MTKIKLIEYPAPSPELGDLIETMDAHRRLIAAAFTIPAEMLQPSRYRFYQGARHQGKSLTMKLLREHSAAIASQLVIEAQK